MTAQLYCFGESGNAYKAALTMTVAGVDWTPVWVDFFHGGARAPEFRAINPMGEVPVLVEGDMVLTQSGVIQLWAAERARPDLAGRTEAERREVLRWMFFDNHKLSGQAGPLRFYTNFLPEAKREPAVIAFQSARLQAALATLDGVLDGRDWLAAPQATLADLACCGYLYYPEPFGFDRAAHPNIDRWLDRISALPGWKHPYDLMPGHPSDRAPAGTP